MELNLIEEESKIKLNHHGHALHLHKMYQTWDPTNLLISLVSLSQPTTVTITQDGMNRYHIQNIRLFQIISELIQINEQIE